MIVISELKPYISAILFSPTLLLLGILFGSFITVKRAPFGRFIILFLTVVLWILASPIFSNWLAHKTLTQYPAVSIQTLKTQGIEVIVVLGGGVDTRQPDGIQQLQPSALDRLRHGVELSRKTQIPILVTGGKGWGADTNSLDEAAILKRVAKEAFQYEIKWTEPNSRDTRENARNCKELLSKLGFKKIALVTHAWHMPRSMKAFLNVGFEVTPAPMGYMNLNELGLLSFLPTGGGLNYTFIIFKELTGLLVQDLLLANTFE